MRARWLVLGSVALALLAAIVVVAVVVIKDATNSGPATSSAECHGAAVDLTVGTIPDAQEVFAQVVVTDREAREWEVEWPTGRTVGPTLPGAALGGRVRHGFQVLGDTDDGPERTVNVRPQGVEEWCRISATVS
jgi:hypothetical protein